MSFVLQYSEHRTVSRSFTEALTDVLEKRRKVTSEVCFTEVRFKLKSFLNSCCLLATVLPLTTWSSLGWYENTTRRTREAGSMIALF